MEAERRKAAIAETCLGAARHGAGTAKSGTILMPYTNIDIRRVLDRARKKAFRAANPEKARAACRKHYIAHREKIKAGRLSYYYANRDEVLASQRIHRNREKHIAYCSMRRRAASQLDQAIHFASTINNLNQLVEKLENKNK